MNVVPILMNQMHISTNYVSSVILRPKSLEIRNISKTVKSQKKQNKREYHEMELIEGHNKGIFLCKTF
jgi:glycerol-3-phosphate responsive antiterminator